MSNIDIKIGTENVPDILKAFNAIETRYVEMENKMTNIAKENILLRTKLEEKATKTKLTEQEKAAKAKEKLDTKAARDQEKLNAKAAKDQEKLNAKEVKDRDRANREIHKLYQKRWADEIKGSEEAAKKIADMETKEANRANREKISMAKKTGNTILNDLKSTASLGAKILGGAFALLGGVGVATGFEQFIALDKKAQEFSHVAGVTGPKISSEEYKDQAKLIGKQYNMSPTDAGDIISKLLEKTGKAKDALAAAPEIAKLAYGEYLDPKLVAELYGQLAVQFPNKSKEDLSFLTGAAVRTTQYGSVDPNELIKLAPAVTAQASRFAGNSNDNVIKQLALIQVANKSTSSPEEAATSVQRLSDDIIKHADSLQKLGVKAFTKDEFGNKKLKPIDAFLQDYIKKVGFDPQQAQKIFGERSGRLINSLSSTYTDTQEKLKNSGLSQTEINKQANEAALKSITDFFSNVNINTEDLDKSVKERLETPAERFKSVILGLQEKFVNMAPEIMKLMDAIKPLIPILGDLLTKFTKMLEWAGDHPIASIGLIMVGLITKSIASAAIGAAISGALTSGIAAAFGVSAVGTGAAVVGSTVAAGTAGTVGAGILGTVAAPIAVTIAALGVGVAVAWWAAKTDPLKEQKNESRTEAIEGAEKLLNPKVIGTFTDPKTGLKVNKVETFTDNEYRTQLTKVAAEAAYEKDITKKQELIKKELAPLLEAFKLNINSDQPNDRLGQVNSFLQELLVNGIKVSTDQQGNITNITVNRGSDGTVIRP